MHDQDGGATDHADSEAEPEASAEAEPSSVIPDAEGEEDEVLICDSATMQQMVIEEARRRINGLQRAGRGDPAAGTDTQCFTCLRVGHYARNCTDHEAAVRRRRFNTPASYALGGRQANRYRREHEMARRGYNSEHDYRVASPRVRTAAAA